MKELVKIKLQDASFLGSTAVNYLKGNVNSLIRFFQDEKGISAAIAGREKKTVNREVLVRVLEQQNKNAPEKSLENIKSLKNANSFTVTTGHQLCLFTGPLYFIYKILHVIKLSEELKIKFPDKNFIPVYWMASEDHDFEEISEVNVFGKKLKWHSEQKGAVGRMLLPETKPVLEQLKQILGDSDRAKEIFSLMDKCYQGKNLSEATRLLVNTLFSEYGLVVLDADDKELKSLFSDIFIKEIEEEFVFSSVNENSKILEQKGLKVQVTPREINIFYLADKSRERIVFENDLYFTADFSKEWSKSQLVAEIKSHPGNFSPNVLMRALYQEAVLPNIVYLGGGGEISYWLQMKKMFEAADLFFPVLMVRNSFLLIDTVQMEKINKLGFEAADFLKPTDELIKQFLVHNTTVEIELEEEKEKLKMVFAGLTKKLERADETLRSSGEAEMQKALKSIEMLEAKIRRAEKQKHEISLNQIKQLKHKFFPEGNFQERYDNFLQFWLKTDGHLIKELHDIMHGTESDLSIIQV